MKSIKPGRGPFMMGGIMSVAMGVFGVILTVVAAGMGGGPFALFGVVFIIIAIVQAVYNFKNATNKNRYSTFDITDGKEEPDPLNAWFGNRAQPSDQQDVPGNTSKFYPYCGNKSRVIMNSATTAAKSCRNGGNTMESNQHIKDFSKLQ